MKKRIKSADVRLSRFTANIVLLEIAIEDRFPKASALFKALTMTPWFIKTSWGYIGSVRKYAVGIFPAWYRFTKLTYMDALE